jgi:hypothetical protein
MTRLSGLRVLDEVPGLSLDGVGLTNIPKTGDLRTLDNAGFDKIIQGARNAPDSLAYIKDALTNVNLTPKQLAKLQAARVNVPPASVNVAKNAGGEPYDTAGKNASRDSYDVARPGDKWKPVKYVAGAAVVLTAIILTAQMIKDAAKGAGNDGKQYNILSLSNQKDTGNMILCKYTPSIEPNGIVAGDTITFEGTDTFLDGNTYSITKKRGSKTECEFEADDRLKEEVKKKGKITLHTNFENHMDDEANDKFNPFSNFPNPFQGLLDSLGSVGTFFVISSIISSCILCVVLMIMLLKR